MKAMTSKRRLSNEELRAKMAKDVLQTVQLRQTRCSAYESHCDVKDEEEFSLRRTGLSCGRKSRLQQQNSYSHQSYYKVTRGLQRPLDYILCFLSCTTYSRLFLLPESWRHPISTLHANQRLAGFVHRSLLCVDVITNFKSSTTSSFTTRESCRLTL